MGDTHPTEPEQSFQLKDRCAILNALCNNQIAIADPPAVRCSHCTALRTRSPAAVGSP